MARGAKKGEVRNPAGKPKGTQNKATKAAKEIIVSLVDELAPQVQGRMDALEDKDWLLVYIKLLDFVVPKVTPIPAIDPMSERPEVTVVP